MSSIYNTETPNTVQCALFGDLDGRIIYNDLFFTRESGYTSANAKILVDDLYRWWADWMQPAISWHFQLQSVIGVGLGPLFGFIVDTFPLPPINGTDGDQLPNNVNYLIQFKTGVPGQSYNGRNYICGIAKNAVIRNTLNPDRRAQFEAAYNQLFTLAAGLDWQWVIVSTETGGVVRPVGITTPVTQVVTRDAYVDSYKRRLPGRRPGPPNPP